MGILSKLFEKAPDLHDDLHFSNDAACIDCSIRYNGAYSDETALLVKQAGEKLRQCFIDEYPINNSYHISSKDGSYYLKQGSNWDCI